MLLERLAQFCQHDAFLGTGFDFDSEHSEAVDELEYAVICRRLYGDNVPGSRHRMQREQQGLLRTIGNGDVIGLHVHTDRVEVVVGNLALERGLTERWRITQAALFGAGHDPFH